MAVGDDVEVLIAGGSLVGLSASLFLAAHGIPSLTVERHPGTAIHPRAALMNQRTIEIYRGVGLEQRIIDESEKEFVQNGAMVAVESLGGKEIEYYYKSINDGVEDLSPSPRIFITQIGLEPLLRERAAEFGGRLEYNTELVSSEQDGDGVTAVVRERASGDERTIRARYLIAADGTHSPIRQRLGIGMQGHGSFSDSLTIYFRADVKPLLGERNLSVVYVFGPKVQGFFRFSLEGDAGFLVVNSAVDENGEKTTRVGEDMSEERCIAHVREALGAPDDLPIEIENIQRWAATADWAERFQDGRIFIAGDAAHVMPPTGGFGGNAGVADAHNLAWKLAAVLRGEAGEPLLDTYDVERRPVGEFTTRQAYTRYVVRLDPSLGMEGVLPFVADDIIELGHRYHSPAIVEEEGDDGELTDNPREPTGRPGTRAPHVPLGDGSSTHDLFGKNFVLVASGGDWAGAGRAAEELGVELDVHAIDSPQFAEAYGTGTDGAVLVRPDAFIGWRARSAPADPAGAVGDALRRILARG
jgi:2-polyprenyl-6-methoxyphenol hydroxylase-like FAD-dependent oxidoreductase